ncbi:MAG: hypothetical protein HY606_01140 [Planctomycetes bacterium]|nr:hypothetical protein [Planctomycetota bacterium]
MTRFLKVAFITLLIAAVTVIWTVNCKGKGGSSGGDTTSGSSSNGTVTVTVENKSTWK